MLGSPSKPPPRYWEVTGTPYVSILKFKVMATIVKITETSNGKDLVRFAHSTSKIIAGRAFESANSILYVL